MKQKKMTKKHTNKKHTNKKHTNKKNKKTKRVTKRNLKMWRGGCGCGLKYNGGKCGCGLKYNGGTCGCGLKYNGGSAFLNELDNKYYYNFNDQYNNPTNPTSIIDERLSGDFSKISGGKRKKKNKRKIKGGDFFSNAYNTISDYGSNMNYITSFGIPNGIGSQMNLLNANNASNSNNPTLQNDPYGFHNRPLV